MGNGFVGAYASGFQVFDYHTEEAATPITENVQAQDGKRLALVTAQILCAGTLQDVSIMYANGTGSRNTASAAAAIGQALLNVTDAPKSPAGAAAADGDIIAYQVEDGTWEFNVVDSIDASEITLKTNIAIAIESGAKVMIFGIPGDNSRFVLHLVASTLYDENNTLLAWHPYRGEPFYVHNPNATAATFHNNLIFAFIANK